MDFSLKDALASDAPTLGALEALSERVSLLRRRELMGQEAATLLGLHELLAYGLRGVAAYAHHAEVRAMHACDACPCRVPVCLYRPALQRVHRLSCHVLNRHSASGAWPLMLLVLLIADVCYVAVPPQMLGQVDASLDDVFEVRSSCTSLASWAVAVFAIRPRRPQTAAITAMWQRLLARSLVPFVSCCTCC